MRQDSKRIQDRLTVVFGVAVLIALAGLPVSATPIPIGAGGGDILGRILDHVPDVLQILALLVMAASLIAQMTPTERDDRIIARIANVVDWLALNWRRPAELEKLSRRLQDRRREALVGSRARAPTADDERPFP